MSFDKLTKNLTFFIGDDLGLIIGAGVAFILLVTFLIYRTLSGRHAKKAARRAPPAILTSGETAEKKAPQGLAAVMESLNQQDAENTAQGTVPLTLEEEDEAANETASQMENPEAAPLSMADAPSSEAETSNSEETSPLDEDIDIPQLGATPQKKKKGFFSFGRNNTEEEAEDIVTTDLSDVAHDENTTDSDEEDSVEESLESSEEANSDALSVQDIMDEIAADVTANLEESAVTNETTAPNAPSRKDMLQDIERQMKALRELHDAGLIATEIYLHKSRELARKING